MGRRSLFSASAFRSLVSAYNAKVRAEERSRLINSQVGTQKELPPEYRIYDFDFNSTSRVAHIDFLEIKHYRKIERYVTQNYTRYPIYGDWQQKTKHIKKTVKLTNEALETLYDYDDKLVCMFCNEIIERIDNQDLAPSWFVRKVIINAQREKEAELVSEKKGALRPIDRNIDDYSRKIKEYNATKKMRHDEITSCLVKKGGLMAKVSKAKTKSKAYVFLLILTFGFYGLSKSKKKIDKLERKIEQCDIEVGKCNDEMLSIDNSIAELQKKINEKETEKALVIKKYNDELENTREEFDELYSKVEPLPIEISNMDSTGFVPLKKLIGIKYEKIVGCYIIHNKEFDKYYVGQSKDVIKRVTRDHFSGTTVKNIIFAEDYYKSKYVNKEDIFEVKIIRLETKDELDSTEKELIEEYDSFYNGYNGTSGNK